MPVVPAASLAWNKRTGSTFVKVSPEEPFYRAADGVGQTPEASVLVVYAILGTHLMDSRQDLSVARSAASFCRQQTHNSANSTLKWPPGWLVRLFFRMSLHLHKPSNIFIP